MTRKVATKPDVPRGTKVDEDGNPVVERPVEKTDGDAPAKPLRRMG